MSFVYWALAIWAICMIVSSFALPFMIGKKREPYTAGTASVGMFFNIGIGVLILAAVIDGMNA